MYGICLNSYAVISARQWTRFWADLVLFLHKYTLNRPLNTVQIEHIYNISLNLQNEFNNF